MGNDGVLLAAIDGFLSPATQQTCLVVAHDDVRTLDGAVDRLVSVYGWARLSVGSELSEVLRHDAPRHRPRRIQRWLTDRLAGSGPGPVLCERIDLLFEPSLELDPLALLLRGSRVARLVVAWPGRYVDDVLEYAVREHAHYHAWRRPDAAVVALA